MNVIIIAVLCLIVLVVLVVIFGGKAADFSKGVEETPCPASARAVDYDQCAEPIFGNYEVETGQVCCKALR